jgi:glycosyltransferase-like protein
MMSVGMVTYSTRPRGSVVHAACLSEALTRAGHDVTLYALGKSGASFWRPIACRVEVLRADEAPADPGALVRQRIDELVDGLRRLSPQHDVFHAQDCLAANALLARRIDGAPVVRTVHHVESYPDPYLADCQRRSILEADAVFGVSRLTQRDVLEQFGRESALVHNGVDASRFGTPGTEQRRRMRMLLGIPASDALVLSVGGVEPRKNTLVALDAMARVHAARPDLRWVIAGGDSIWDHSDYVAAFDARLAELPAGFAARVVRAGTVAEEDLAALYGASDVLLCASELEGFGLSVLEGMAAGVPVVAPDREPFTEYLGEGTALLVDGRSPAALGHAVLRLLHDDALRARLVDGARRSAAAFSWSRSADDHVSLYRALASSRGASAMHPQSHESHPDA